MHEANQRQQVEAFVAQHRDRFTPSAIRARLIADGADAAIVDAVLAEIYAASGSAVVTPDTGSKAPGNTLRPWQLFWTLLAYGPLNLILLLLLTWVSGVGTASSNTLLGAVLFFGIVAGLAALAYRLKRSSIAAGLLTGYALMSLVSGGTCTLLNGVQSETLIFSGLFLYPPLALIVGAGWLVWCRLQSRSRS